jgi:serine/threonine protein kinase
VRNTYGRWHTIRRLGGGGNAEVYVATDDVGEAALKVLHLRKQSAESEAYRRFRDEIAIHRRLTPRKGILPLLDANLPESPSRDDPGWLVTPLATPIERELGDRPELHRVVETVAELAEVLAGLAEEGISHRDIKPNNLYAYQGEYVLGDFGLVSYPGKEIVTDGNRAVGPIYFQAPEMIFTPGTADGRLADVYSLAKTLWVLAAGQRWPLPGEHG